MKILYLLFEIIKEQHLKKNISNTICCHYNIVFNYIYTILNNIIHF